MKINGQTAFFLAKLGTGLLLVSLCLINSLTLFATTDGQPNCFADNSHILLSSVHNYLKEYSTIKKAIMIFNSLVIDSCLIILIYAFLQYGKTWKPVLRIGLFMLIKSVLQLIYLEQLDKDNLWDFPGIPSILISYSKTNDLFVSGHIGITLLMANELWNFREYNEKFQFTAIGCYIMVPWISVFDLSIRSQYFLDVFAGCLLAHFIILNSKLASTYFDRNFSLEDTQIAYKEPDSRALLKYKKFKTQFRAFSTYMLSIIRIIDISDISICFEDWGLGPIPKPHHLNKYPK